MKKSKAILVVIVMTIMLFVIIAFLCAAKAAIFKILFSIIVGIFFGIGIGCSNFMLFNWLTDDDEPEELAPVEVSADPVQPDETDLTYEAIRDALEATL